MDNVPVLFLVLFAGFSCGMVFTVVALVVYGIYGLFKALQNN